MSGYFRQPMERPPTNSVGFQPAGQNIVSAGVPIPGDVINKCFLFLILLDASSPLTLHLMSLF